MDSVVMQKTLNGNGALAQRIRAVQQEVKQRATNFQAKLAVIDNGIRGWELDKQSSRDTGNKPGLAEANKQLVILAPHRAAWVEEMERASKDDAVLAEPADLMNRGR